MRSPCILLWYPGVLNSKHSFMSMIEHGNVRSKNLTLALLMRNTFASVDDGSFWNKSRDAPDTPEIDRVTV